MYRTNQSGTSIAPEYNPSGIANPWREILGENLYVPGIIRPL
jgi:hypothetical protein